MLLYDKKIAIIGGGPGGLTLANLLQQQGLDVQVYERDYDKNARVQGATLDLHVGSGLEALKRAGLLSAFYENYRPNAGKLRVLDQNGLVHYDEHSSPDSVSEDRPEIDRGPLRKILLDALDAGTVVWNSHFQSLVKQDTGWLLNFENGQSIYADFVVAADGANSKIRPYISDTKALYSGVTIVEGNVYNAQENAPQLYDLVNGGKLFAFGNTQSIILSAKGDGSLSFYTGCREAAHWTESSGLDFGDKKQVLKWFKAAFASWSPLWQELFQSDSLWFVPRPQYHFPLDQTWPTLGTLTMIGDAAHRMPPYAGEGVNMAMQDAFELAESLCNSNFTSLDEAISAFERGMQKRAQEITAMTLYQTEKLHAEGAIAHILRVFKGED
ncbi:FAD-dependent monooxygenase [Marinilongibacter aquaticus]|uniref:FAD-dependent oxidoreductase n=1 Tax=Marinilongibacter aquaticus TaxID=2975157 RepID=UPI0021BD74A9|nr:NAD(P)/FAD-dependent oxidoreductase [Marinilongibacter aquaticus]UBM58368.1 FAD-dependent monooxygenase [Marinilongibacter aquaticus]